MADILPPSIAESTPPDRFIQAMARLDGCGECVTNYEAPYRVEIHAESFTAYYRCTDCRHLWVTAWGSY